MVYVLNRYNKPLMPCSNRKARLLLKQNKAIVIKKTPFTIKLKFGSSNYKQDIILGVISKTAPQVNVFQLSFLFKPVFGAAIMIWILPMLIDVISDFFLSFSSIY